MTDELQLIIRDATQAITQAKRLADLEQLRSSWIGKKSALSAYLRELAQLPASERPIRGQAVNEAKQQIEALLRAQSELLKAEDLTEKLGHETVDVTLAGRGRSIGSLHPVTRTRERIESFFTRVGFSVEDGPEIEDDYHNFEALNLPSDHPARALHDTFYFPDGLLLRTHTSTVQIRALEQGKVPLKMIAIGRVYRRDLDITHAPMFHQLEGLVVNETANFSELKGILSEFLQKFFEKDDLTTRFRPAYFPFTEPSAEVDIQCVLCSGSGCRVCKQTGYLEILGCGMVHPQVLERVGVSSEKYQAYAFGLGIDRLAMLRYGIPDIRLLFENDCRFLEQF